MWWRAYFANSGFAVRGWRDIASVWGGIRDLLGFISYGYAQELLRLDRVEEFSLFLYAHRYHAHTLGSWTAGEVTGITGYLPFFCVPAQLTIPLLVRWLLAFEESDAERLHLGRAAA